MKINYTIIYFLIISLSILLFNDLFCQDLHMRAFEGIPIAIEYSSFVKQRYDAVLCHIFMGSGITVKDGARQMTYTLPTSWNYVFRDKNDYIIATCKKLSADRVPFIYPSDITYKSKNDEIHELRNLKVNSDRAIDLSVLNFGKYVAGFSYMSLEMETVDGELRPLWTILADTLKIAITADDGKIAYPINKNSGFWKTIN